MSIPRTGIVFALAVAITWGQPKSTTWTVSPDVEKSVLTISHAALGVVMKDVKLHVRGPAGLVPVQRWKIEDRGEGEFLLTSESPRTGWKITVRDQLLSINTTSDAAVLTASVPAGPQRIVARLMDPQGTPVDWVGTNEVKGGYGGSETRNRSFLPRRNPDVLYFSLGQVSGSEFHALFDRRTDTAVDFGPGSNLKRNPTDPDLLDLTLPVEGSVTARAIPEYFTKVLGTPYYVPFDDTKFRRAPMVWSSWTSYYEDVREEDIVRNADWLSANLKPFGFEYVQLDDGFDRGPKGEHYWIENWDKEKFPHGPQWLTQYIKSKGLKAGLWLVPNAYAGAVKDHPDWYLRDRKNGLILDYNTPSLDTSHPDALAFVRRMFTTLDNWGFDYYKFDGEHALPRYVPAIDRYKLHDPNSDLLANYQRRLAAIREVLGPDRFIEGCPAGTPLNGIGYFNSYFTGHDLYNTWLGMYPLFSSINANVFLNHIVVYVMPGEGLELGLPMSVEEASRKRPKIVIDTAKTRETPLTTFGLNDAEARTLVTYVALTGVAYPLASVMSELPAERVQLLKQTMPTMPILPVDLFSRGTDMQWNTFQKERP
ncbi:MAG: glycoside hydrolase family 36 protein, partial [Bryobacteraceae bacterium]